MPKIDPDEVFNELEKTEIPANIEHKLRKFAQQKDMKLVLSLGGGGAKGCVGNFGLVYLLHKLDLMKHFEEVWGVSAGSMIGAGYCSGIPMKEFIKILCTIRLRDFISINVKNSKGEEGYLSNDRVFALFERILPVKTFEDCKKPLFLLSTRYTGESEETVVFHKGPLVQAVAASISIPDVFQPVIIDGKTYCDGGLVENTPCLSVYRRHRDLQDNRKLAILSTCFGKEHFHEELGRNAIQKLMNLLAVYRYELQLTQNELTRMQPNTAMLMLNIDVPIPKMGFNKMAPQIVPVYGQILDKFSYICELNNWNITY